MGKWLCCNFAAGTLTLTQAQVHVCLPVCGAPWWVLLQHCNMLWIFFHHRVWYCMLSLRCACILSSGIILIPYATFVPNFVSFVGSIAELAHGEKLHTHSVSQPAYLVSVRWTNRQTELWLPRCTSIAALCGKNRILVSNQGFKL